MIDLAELAGHPNSVFARDAGLVTPVGYIKLRMGLRTRRGEDGWLAAAVASRGVPAAGAIEPPGTVEGGDVILAGQVAFVGRSARTNASGVRQLSRLLGEMDYEIRTIRLPASRLHIGGEMSLAGPETVLCYKGLFPRGFFEGFKTIEIPESGTASANIISLGGGGVIVGKTQLGRHRGARESRFCRPDARPLGVRQGKGRAELPHHAHREGLILEFRIPGIEEGPMIRHETTRRYSSILYNLFIINYLHGICSAGGDTVKPVLKRWAIFSPTGPRRAFGGPRALTRSRKATLCRGRPRRA